MAYATSDDLQARCLERDLIAITDETNQAVDVARLTTALGDASAEIDGYLGMRYVLPLVDAVSGAAIAPSPVLVRMCCDMALYNLQVLRPADDIKDAVARYNLALKMLRMMSVGDVQIAGARLLDGQAAFPPDASQSTGNVQFSSPRHPDTFGRRSR
ncbi:DUF1320 family protein [Burkholderia cenocepacia]|uniref:gp436 family protein n=1 Tax=Burkholderia cenocepacia TaxID=95486 RepID=UPI001AA1A809|nr:DUF1320 domain-containing protein [Burkholderia cenocepacia]MBO1856845.1 DUF1320 family protein [Burkholderia cenocepacia]